MPSDRFDEEKHLIAKEELLEHASLAVLRNSVAGTPIVSGWHRGAIRKGPLAIYDINGSLLFFDYQVSRGTEVLGYVRTAASKVLGPPVVSLEIGPRSWNFDRAVEKLTPNVKKENPRAAISGPKLVCYSYPKLGVMFEVSSPKGSAKWIYDVASLNPISLLAGEDYEGAFAWSFYGSLNNQQRQTRLRLFNRFEKARTEIPEGRRVRLAAARSLEDYLNQVGFKFRFNHVKQLQFCTHYAATCARSHHCFVLHGQQKDQYCAVACCQMILCYYRYYYTQDEIAPALGYTGTGCPADQSPGYKSLTCNHLDATFDDSPSWEKARDQIDALHPLKSGIKKHARVCAGYSHTGWLSGGAPNKQLLVYDPWPWNADFSLAGTVAWEDWDSVTHTNYVCTKIKCP